MKNQRGFALIGIVLFLMLAVMVGGAVYTTIYKSQLNDPEGASPPGVVKITLDETFTISLPEGWSKQAAPPDVYPATESYDDGAVHYYGDSNGNYFVVHVDPPGRDFASDVSWGLEGSGKGYKVVHEEPMCKAEEAFCSAGNSKLELGMMAEPRALNGHNYFFFAGNYTREAGVDTQVFKDILMSFKVK